MTKDKTETISGEPSLDYGSAFCDAVMRFRDEWNPAAPEFSVEIRGRPFLLSDLCRLARGVDGHVPRNVLDRLLLEMHDARYTRCKTELANNPSYPTAADCLSTLINESKAALQRLDEERFRTPGVKLLAKRGKDEGSEET
jgi:hypothetical protein